MTRILVTHAIELEKIELHLPGAEIKTIFTGIGKANAAMSLMQAALEYQPDFVLNIGSSGTFNHAVGDVIISTHFVDRDLERMNLFGLDFDIHTVRPAGFQLKSVLSGQQTEGDFIVNSGDDFVTSGHPATGDAVDMEVFAEAMVCNRLNLPMVSVKYITDVVGQNSVALWEEKLADARKELTAFFEKNAVFTV